VSEQECFEVLSERYLTKAHEARAAGKLREAYRCISASVYCARRAETVRAADRAVAARRAEAAGLPRGITLHRLPANDCTCRDCNR
jgi:hypothetical protein